MRVLPVVLLVLCAGAAHAKVKKPISEAAVTAPAPAPFDPQEATRQIRARMGGVRACYANASRREPGLRGKLQLGFDVGDSGQVAATQVEVDGLHTDADPAAVAGLTACIRNQALGWRLSPEGTAGAAHVSYVFVFEGAN